MCVLAYYNICLIYLLLQGKKRKRKDTAKSTDNHDVKKRKKNKKTKQVAVKVTQNEDIASEEVENNGEEASIENEEMGE